MFIVCTRDSLHVFESLHEAVLVSVRTELGVLGGEWVELVHVDQSVVRQYCLHPHAAYVVFARRHQHVRH